jgi:hypothetical protein
MAEKKKSFSDLLSEAPLAPAEDTVSLVGALARSSQAGKFILALSQGNSITLDVDAVKGYQVIGGGVGQLLVQVDVDKTKVPQAAAVAEPAKLPVTGVHDLKSPIADYKHPTLDKYPWEEPVRTHPETDVSFTAHASPNLTFTGIHDYKHPTLDKHPWEEVVHTNPETDLAPFALATPQQAPASALEAMQAGPGSALKTVWAYDLNTGYRDHPKLPWLDATGRPPYLD